MRRISERCWDTVDLMDVLRCFFDCSDLSWKPLKLEKSLGDDLEREIDMALALALVFSMDM
jgi:hypothetical protein